ncbi:hypothetical protein ElyMa_006159400 [Elysia marginata]|uniref:Uncharacterized protein n=1 Tax=Elysia marginata TaxID=1093978 RepID=A0AAV4GZH9_9GAST|nr:hypothetical protein ElyMa_006159400 [Elysia marginata]
MTSSREKASCSCSIFTAVAGRNESELSPPENIVKPKLPLCSTHAQYVGSLSCSSTTQSKQSPLGCSSPETDQGSADSEDLRTSCKIRCTKSKSRRSKSGPKQQQQQRPFTGLQRLVPSIKHKKAVSKVRGAFNRSLYFSLLEFISATPNCPHTVGAS